MSRIEDSTLQEKRWLHGEATSVDQKGCPRSLGGRVRTLASPGLSSLKKNEISHFEPDWQSSFTNWKIINFHEKTMGMIFLIAVFGFANAIDYDQQ